MTRLIFFLTSLVLILSFGSSCRNTAAETLLPDVTQQSTLATRAIDGTIHPGEWSDADTYKISNGSDLYLLRKDQTLYLAVIASTPGTLGANIFLSRDDQVTIMHISAALGTAKYKWNGEVWSLIRNFDWQHRRVGNGELALAEREAYLEKEGWTAPNARTGTANHLEMQIQLSEEQVWIAVSLIRSSSNLRIVWPTELGDDTGTAFSDGLPDTLSVELESWFLIP